MTQVFLQLRKQCLFGTDPNKFHITILFVLFSENVNYDAKMIIRTNSELYRNRNICQNIGDMTFHVIQRKPTASDSVMEVGKMAWKLKSNING